MPDSSPPLGGARGKEVSTVPTEPSDFERLIADIGGTIATIPGGVAAKVGLFAHFNRRGTRPPLFWCFNNWAEPVFLANRLGPDQPLYAMRSLHGFLVGGAAKKEHMRALASRYADDMRALIAGPAIIGGNCQAGPIAEAVAHRIVAQGDTIPLLVTLEHEPYHCYPGEVVLLFGSRSERYNPFLRGEDPVPRWRRQFRDVAWGSVRGEHGKFFMAPAVFDLIDHIGTASSIFHATGKGPAGEMALPPPVAV